MKNLTVLCLALLLAWVPELSATLTGESDPLVLGFMNPPEAARPQTWWHWMNGNITKAGITADLEAMKEIGLGGATLVNIYSEPQTPNGPAPFMSSEWRDDFKFAVQEANRLGLALTVENCAGWSSSGGPWITPENAMQQVVYSELTLSGPTNYSATLPPPPTKLGFYRDIAVLAYPVDAGVSMNGFSPVATASSNSAEAAKILDGDERTFLKLPAPKPGQPQFVQLAFAQPFAARTVKIVAGPDMPECQGEVQISDDGRSFKTVSAIKIASRPLVPCVISLGHEPRKARFWRLSFKGISRHAKVTILPIAEVSLESFLSVKDLASKAGAEINVNSGGNELLPDRTMNSNLLTGISRQKIVDLTAQLTESGQLSWQVPPGKWMVQRFGYTPTGANNAPAPVAGTGLECDKLSQAALDAHWAGFMRQVLADIKPLGGRGLTGSLIDSYEVGPQTWTQSFREEFQRRRGYDLRPWLPVLTGRVVDNSALTYRFLWDVRRTVADLFAENYFGHFAELCHTNGLLNSVEPYTGPYESMQSGGFADVVMGEFWQGLPVKESSSVKLASSIAHVYGKTIVGAESFTTRPEGDHGRWLDEPYGMKPMGDLMFVHGVNRYLFHRFVMQPWTNRSPGMTMGRWGFHFERTLTWWHPGKAWIEYITRCQYLLQQGRFVADAAYFTGENAPSTLRAGDPKLPAGYDYDGVNAEVLLSGATVKNGRLTLASGASYAALILPPSDRNMTPALLQRIAELVRDGATVVGAPPSQSPSLADFPDCDAQIKKITAELWGTADGIQIKENTYGKGRIVWGQPLGEVFARQNLKPDFEFTAVDVESQWVSAHRATASADIYFVSNQRRQAETAAAIFRVSGKIPELWHPDTGVIERAPIWHEQDGRTTVRLSLDPAGSVFVVFRAAASGDPVVSTQMDPQWQVVSDPIGELRVKASCDGRAAFQTVSGKTWQAVAVGVPVRQEVAGPWTLNFPPNWGAPPTVQLAKLISWPDSPDQGVKYFSGTASYEKTLAIGAERLQAGRELWLDLGSVKHFAEVFLNGQSLGILWKPPFRLNLTPAARAGENKLVVKVTNLWPNRLIGDEQLPADVEWSGNGAIKAWPQWLQDGKPSPTGRLTFTTWHHWSRTDKLLESGLLGPVTLQTLQVIAATPADSKVKP